MRSWCWRGLLSLIAVQSTAWAQEAPRGPEVGLGVRNALSEEGYVEGASLLGRYRAGVLSVEGGLFWGWSTLRYGGLETFLAALADEHGYDAPTTSADRLAGSVLVGLHPWALGGRGAAPVLYLGAEARAQDRYSLTYTDGPEAVTATPLEGRLLAGPLLGAGIEADLGPAGLRFSLRGRPHFDLSAGDLSDPEVDVVLQLDAFFRPYARGGR